MYLYAYTLYNDQIRAVTIVIVSNVYPKTKTSKVISQKGKKVEGRQERDRSELVSTLSKLHDRNNTLECSFVK